MIIEIIKEDVIIGLFFAIGLPVTFKLANFVDFIVDIVFWDND